MKTELKPTKNKLSQSEYEELLIRNWPTWEKEVSRFQYTYDETEECYFLEGLVTIEYGSERLDIEPFDFVVFPNGLECIWDIKTKVKKHYRFNTGS